ncbi:flagellar motor protein MotB [Thiocystis violascens]|uniref:Flagellar motor protein n=1 Tax=Thiocystis violascens (strain ATCC 17096 / DSM 198 / 6111) TaxID=765911 RepID=I3Y602_THIV6|nr:flagellar motor protein MotB [Thiocystis violascens]AFL72420.1 flagellar motor protein [Thiocystis violascens DSM 198]
MPIDTNKQPIVVRKVFKSGGHHGGAWKIAFADFATAMMAFFMLLWILGATTKEQKAAISQYFQNPSAFEGVSTAPSQALGEGTGSKPSIIDFEGAIDMAPEASRPTAEQIDELAQTQDQARLESLRKVLEDALKQSATLAPYKEQLLIDIVSEGLRIQIVDEENRPMFDSGDTQLKHYTSAILRELGTMINQVPNRISLTGHTDARPLARAGFSNWELSTERANAARRALVAGGMREDKIGRVVGFADTVPFDKADINNPINRRISIIVMNQKTDAAIHEETTTANQLLDQN